MVKFLLGILTGVVLTVLLFAAIAAMGWALGEGEPGISADSVLALRLAGDVPEHIGTEFSLDFLDQSPRPTLLDVRDALLKAAVDKRIRGVALEFGDLGIGWAKAQELRWAIQEFRRANKPVYAYLERGGTMEYYVASAADEIYVAPEGLLDVKGLRAEVSFYKDTLGKLGVEAEMENVGKYKSAVEPYSRSEMSESFREVTNSLLDELYGQLVNDLAEARGMTPDELRAAIDNGPFLPQGALDNRLIDGLLYPDEFSDLIQDRLELEELKEVRLPAYRRVSLDSLGLGGGEKVAIVYGVGSIMAGDSETDPFFGVEILGSDSFAKTLRGVRDDDDIKAVILRIDSPGGDALASDIMWREVNLLREKKPVVVSMSDVAASGGYYIAAAKGVPIIAYPGTYTGSIGVFFGKMNLRGLYEKIGVSKEIITRGRFADIDTDYRSFTPAEREKVREGIEQVYKTFVEKVAEARDADWEAIHEVAQGRVWLGSQAIEIGLVDELGGFDRAIARVKKEAGIDEDERVRLVTYPAPKSFFDVLLETRGLARIAAALQPTLRLPAALRAELGEFSLWPALLEGGIFRAAPYAITIH